MDQPIRIIVIMPVFEDRASCLPVLAELGALPELQVRVVLVDDGSVREPMQVDDLRRARVAGELLRLCRNVGHQRALAIGLAHALQNGPVDVPLVLMDSDGEDRPEAVAELIERLVGGDGREGCDVVVAARGLRFEGLAFQLFYQAYRIVFKVLTGKSIRFGNFMALTPAAAHRLLVMRELRTHVAAAVLASRLRISACQLDRGRRHRGRSKMNFVSLIQHAFRGMMVFSDSVLARVGLASATVAGLSILSAAVAIGLKLSGFSTPGWFSVAVGLLAIMVLQTGTLALITLLLAGLSGSGERADPAEDLRLVDEVLQA